MLGGEDALGMELDGKMVADAPHLVHMEGGENHGS